MSEPLEDLSTLSGLSSDEVGGSGCRGGLISVMRGKKKAGFTPPCCIHVHVQKSKT